jgi:hypothetical protein
VYSPRAVERRWSMNARRLTALLALSIAVAMLGSLRSAAAQVHPPVAAQPDAPPELPVLPKTPRERRPFSAALLLGYGATLDDGSSARTGGNGFGVGFGGTFGYDVSLFYFGARFMFFLGGADDGGDVVVSRKQTTLGLEAGVALSLARLTLRPEVGFGLAIESAERGLTDAGGTAVTEDDSSEDVYVAPGLAALFDLDGSLFLGLDAQVPLIIADTTLIGLTVLGSAGLRF